MNITRDTVLEVAFDLLSIPSVNPRDQAQVAREDILGESEICNFIASWLNKHGVPAEVLHYAPGRANCVATLGKNKGPTLWLNGHVDTVAPHFLNEESFVPRVSGDSLYGIGAADMKGAIASMMVALAAAANNPPEGRVIFSAVGGEEGPPSGTEFLINQGWSADVAIVGEPTHLALFVGQKGGMWVKIKSVGRPGHGCMPDQGVNAIKGLVAYLYTLDKEPPPTFRYENNIYGKTTYNIGVFSGGHRPNIIPAEASAILDIRFIPGHTPEQILEELRQHAELSKQNAKVSCEFVIDVIEGPSEPLGVSEDHPLVSYIIRIMEATLGGPVQLGWAPFWSDAYYYYKKGIPALIVGPGGIEQAHQANERVSITELWKAAQLYYNLIINIKQLEGGVCYDLEGLSKEL